MRLLSSGTVPPRTVLVGEAIRDATNLPSPATIILVDRMMPRIPPALAGAVARPMEAYRHGGLGCVQATEIADRLMKAWAGATDSSGRRLDEIVRYEGISLWELVEVDFLYNRFGPLIDDVMLWRRLLEVERPSQVLVAHDRLGRIAGLVAQAQDINVRQVSPRLRHGRGRVRSLAARISPEGRAWLRRWRSQLWCWRARWYHWRVRSRSQGVEGGRKILVLTYTSKCVEIPIEVTRALQAEAGNRVLVLDRNFSSATPRLAQAHLAFRVLEGYGTREILDRVRREEKRLRQAWSRLRGDPAFQRQFAYEGIGLWPLIEPILQEYFIAFFPEVVRLFEVARRAVRLERPAAAVITDDRPVFQRLVVWACRKEGVPTVGVQENIIADLPFGTSPVSADWVAVQGAAAREALIKRGSPASRIVVTGQPRFDALMRLGPRFNRGRILRDLGLDPHRPMVFLASQYTSVYFRAEEKRLVFQALAEAVMRLAEVQWIVKLHPDEPDGSVEQALQACGPARCRLIKTGDSLALVFASDVVLVFYSTVGYEAIVMDRPLIQITAAAQERPVVSFTDEGAALDVRHLEDMPAMIQAALRDPPTRERLRQGRQAFIRRQFHALDGRSAERVAELVARVAEGHPPEGLG